MLLCTLVPPSSRRSPELHPSPRSPAAVGAAAAGRRQSATATVQLPSPQHTPHASAGNPGTCVPKVAKRIHAQLHTHGGASVNKGDEATRLLRLAPRPLSLPHRWCLQSQRQPPCGAAAQVAWGGGRHMDGQAGSWGNAPTEAKAASHSQVRANTSAPVLPTSAPPPPPPLPRAAAGELTRGACWPLRPSIPPLSTRG